MSLALTTRTGAPSSEQMSRMTLWTYEDTLAPRDASLAAEAPLCVHVNARGHLGQKGHTGVDQQTVAPSVGHHGGSAAAEAALCACPRPNNSVCLSPSCEQMILPTGRQMDESSPSSSTDRVQGLQQRFVNKRTNR